MNDKSFLDTNVLVYAATGREDSAPRKYRRAQVIVADENLSLSRADDRRILYVNVKTRRK